MLLSRVFRCAAFTVFSFCCYFGFAAGIGDSSPISEPGFIPSGTTVYDVAKILLANEAEASKTMGPLFELPTVQASAVPGSNPAAATSPDLASSAAVPSGTLRHSASPSQSPAPPVLRSALEFFGPRTFNPAFARDPASVLIRRMTQSTLVVPAPQLPDGYAPVLAESWNLAADGKSFEILIKGKARWSDGTPIVASDWTEAAVMVYDEPEAMSVQIGGRFTWSAKNDHTLVLSSPEALPISAYLEACTRFPLPISRYKKWRDLGTPGSLGNGLHSPAEASRFMFFDSKVSDLVASGPWKIAEYVSGDHLKLVPNEYFDPTAILLQPWPQGITIEFRFVRDAESAAALVHSGSIDVYGVQADVLWDEIGVKPPAAKRVFADAGPLTLSIALNTRSGSIFASRDNRLTIARLVDRRDIAEKVLGSSAFPAIALWAGRLANARAKDQKPQASVTTSPAAAPQSLKSFVLLFEKDNASRALIAANIAAKCADVGIKVELRPTSFDEMIAKMAVTGEWEAALMSVDESRDPSNLSMIWPEIGKNGDTLSDIFAQVYQEQFLIPIVRFRNLVFIKSDSAVSPSVAAWLINRFQVAERGFL